MRNRKRVVFLPLVRESITPKKLCPSFVDMDLLFGIEQQHRQPLLIREFQCLRQPDRQKRRRPRIGFNRSRGDDRT